MSTPIKNPSIEIATAPPPSRSWLASDALPETRVRVGFDSIEERRHVLDWLNAGLRDGRPGRLLNEYPLLFEKDANVLPFTLWEGSAPVAFCLLWAVPFRIGGRRLRAGMISLVFTDEAFRGRGHASHVLRAAIDHAERLDLGLLLLWSELDALYAALGFVEAGQESLLVVDSSTVERALRGDRVGADTRVERARPSDWPEIERLRSFRTCQLEIDPGELLRARTIPDLDVRVARDATGIRGFAMRGRGDDLADVIHEWGGDPDAALLCCASHLSACASGDELFLMTPTDDDALSWSLRRAGARRIHKPLAWMRIASPSALADDLASMLPGLAGFTIEVEPGGDDRPGEVLLRSASGETRVDPTRLFDALFGSPRIRDSAALADALAPALGAAARAHLPIPFFVWGLESI